MKFVVVGTVDSLLEVSTANNYLVERKIAALIKNSRKGLGLKAVASGDSFIPPSVNVEKTFDEIIVRVTGSVGDTFESRVRKLVQHVARREGYGFRDASRNDSNITITFGRLGNKPYTNETF